MTDTSTTLAALSDAAEYVQQGLTGVQIRENLERDHSTTPEEARLIIIYARSLVYRLKDDD